MSSSNLSQSSALRSIGMLFGAVPFGYGINAILRPDDALTLFKLEPPALPADKALVNSLIAIYGIRNLFMGTAIFAAGYHRAHKTLGWILIALGGVAFGDGLVCYQAGKGGEWGHWGYAPVSAIVGSLFLGLLG
ncbi:hypothetical protein CJF32_00009952 [Rutstroemia sp. NJR-2017a WRK4]|nr:hypothetical protein CJF32_00009952 [Rutstroemia sp. NJR-2017a WRK4]